MAPNQDGPTTCSYLEAQGVPFRQAMRILAPLLLLAATDVWGFNVSPPCRKGLRTASCSVSRHGQRRDGMYGGAPSLVSQATQARGVLAIDDPALGIKLRFAEFSGIRNEEAGMESYAWSHASRNDASIILQLTARIEEMGGKVRFRHDDDQI